MIAIGNILKIDVTTSLFYEGNNIYCINYTEKTRTSLYGLTEAVTERSEKSRDFVEGKRWEDKKAHGAKGAA